MYYKILDMAELIILESGLIDYRYDFGHTPKKVLLLNALQVGIHVVICG
jgi:hypothetical protein